jgi:hypothetical protein
MQQIYVTRAGQQTGPFTEAEIRAQLASGALTGDAPVWWEGLADWTPISRTPLGAPAAPGGTAAVMPPIPPIDNASAAATFTGVKKTSKLAVTSLVLGIFGMLCLTAVGAIITGHVARDKIGKDRSLTGDGMALAGLIMGYIWIAATPFISIVAISVLIALGNQVKGVFTTISSQIAVPETTNSAPANPGQ